MLKLLIFLPIIFAKCARRRDFEAFFQKVGVNNFQDNTSLRTSLVTKLKKYGAKLHKVSFKTNAMTGLF